MGLGPLFPQASRAADLTQVRDALVLGNHLQVGNRRPRIPAPSLPGWVTLCKPRLFPPVRGGTKDPRAPSSSAAYRASSAPTTHEDSMLGGLWALCLGRGSSLLGLGLHTACSLPPSLWVPSQEQKATCCQLALQGRWPGARTSLR